MQYTATIEFNDETITVTGDVYEETNERGTGVVVVLDEPHDTAEYRYLAESALEREYDKALLDAQDY
jgi:hypothetical protein